MIVKRGGCRVGILLVRRFLRKDFNLSTHALHFATFLAPSIYPAYEFISNYVGQQLGIPTELVVGESFTQFAKGSVDIGFICGLPYVQLTRQNPSPIELLAAPILQGERYGGKPIYYSDVIVRADSPFYSFEDLRGRSWSYNDLDSQSGYGITRHRLVQMGETRGYFGEVVCAGFHQESINMVCRGEIDASAIDSQVLGVAMRDDPDLSAQLRIIDSLGPSTIQPVVAANHLSDSLKADIREILLTMSSDINVRAHLAQGFFEGFAPVTDTDYDDIRAMLNAAEDAEFLTLK